MHDLDSIKLAENTGPTRVLNILTAFPKQCSDASMLVKEDSLKRPDTRISNIVFAGLGGSAIGADIVRVYLQGEMRIPAVVWRNYNLPGFAGKDTLLFCLSYSGNTAETVSAFEEGIKRGAYIITIGSGGRLKELAMEKGVYHISIPEGLLPRTAIGYMSLPLIKVLSSFGYISDKAKEIDIMCSSLSDLESKGIGYRVPLKENLSKFIANKVYGRYCALYGTADSTETVALRWKEQFAENAKNISTSNVFPEANHNEIEGWNFPKHILKNAVVILLKDRNDHKQTNIKVDIAKDIMERSGIEVLEIERDDVSLLSRIYSLIYIGDFVSLYLALLNGVDPVPITKIEELKRLSS